MKYPTGAYADELDNQPEHHPTGPREQRGWPWVTSLIYKPSLEARQPSMTPELRLD
jgi:hypothetical protein